MFDSSHFMPHGHCYLWMPQILWLHVISDGLIALAYFSIPLALIYFIRKRKDLTFKWVFVLFGLFIFSCGLTHIASIYTIWIPNYGAEGLIKAVTAAVSLATAVFLWPIIPKALKLPSPEVFAKKNKELEDLTKNLERKVAETVGDSIRLAQIVSHSHDAIFSKTLDGKILSWNKSAERIFGFTSEEMIGQSVFKIVPESKIKEEKDTLKKISSGIDSEPFESIRKCKDGSEILVNCSISPIQDSSGNIIGASSIMRDITAKKQLDKKLSDTTEILKERNEQLVNINTAKDEFIANLSHELRSPLNIIIGYSELMNNFKPESLEYKSAVDVIKRNAETQLHLIEDLLDMSRIISGKFSVSVKEANIDDIINSSIKAIEFSAKNKNITILIETESSEKTLICDQERIQQVLWNLLTNAVKFTDRGGSITLKSGRENGNFIFEIRDTGRGISQTDLPHVFDRLWQSSQGREKNSGLGLGLRITKDLVEAHGGHISAYSDGEGKGSTFKVSLPIKAVSINENVPNIVSPQTRLKGMTILVVDDSEDALHLVRLVLESVGAKVVTAVDGAEALEIVRKNNIQLIVSDINMPIMDGFAFMENTRRVESEKGIKANRPAIALTARTGPGEKERAYKAGYQLHMVKPVKPDVLVENILAVIKKA